MNADVLAFACLATSPGGSAACQRQRWHAGDHRGTAPASSDHPYAVPERLLEWPDPPAPPNPEERVMAFGDRHIDQGPPLMHGLDEASESWAPVAPLEGQVDPPWWHGLEKHLRTLAAVVVLVALACAPAVIIAVYRAALG